MAGRYNFSALNSPALFVALCLAYVSAVAVALSATDYVWQGGGGLRDWNDTSLWRGDPDSPNFPCTGQSVALPPGSGVMVRGRARIRTLVFNGTGVRVRVAFQSKLQVKNTSPAERWCSVSTLGPTSPPLVGSVRLPDVVSVPVATTWTKVLNPDELFVDAGDGEPFTLGVTFQPAPAPGTGVVAAYDTGTRTVTVSFPTVRAARVAGITDALNVTVFAKNSNDRPAVQYMLLRPLPDLSMPGLVASKVLNYAARTPFQGFDILKIAAPSTRIVGIQIVADFPPTIGDAEFSTTVYNGIVSRFVKGPPGHTTWSCTGPTEDVNVILASLVFYPRSFHQVLEMNVTVTDTSGNDPVVGHIILSTANPSNSPPRLAYSGSTVQNVPNPSATVGEQFFVDLSLAFTDPDEGDKLYYHVVFLVPHTGRAVELNDTQISEWQCYVDQRGSFSCTPTSAGSFQFYVTATDTSRALVGAFMNIVTKDAPSETKQSTMDTIIAFVSTFGSFVLAFLAWGLIQFSKHVRTRGNRHFSPLAYYVQRELGMESVGKFTSGHEHGSETGFQFHENICELAKAFSARVEEAAAESKASGNGAVPAELLNEWKTLGDEAGRTVFQEEAPAVFDKMRVYGRLVARASMGIPAIKRSGPLVNIQFIHLQLFSGIEPSHFKLFRDDIVEELLRIVLLQEERVHLAASLAERTKKEEERASAAAKSGSMRHIRRALGKATDSAEALELTDSTYQRPSSSSSTGPLVTSA